MLYVRWWEATIVILVVLWVLGQVSGQNPGF